MRLEITGLDALQRHMTDNVMGGFAGESVKEWQSTRCHSRKAKGTF